MLIYPSSENFVPIDRCKKKDFEPVFQFDFCYARAADFKVAEPSFFQSSKLSADFPSTEHNWKVGEVYYQKVRTWNNSKQKIDRELVLNNDDFGRIASPFQCEASMEAHSIPYDQ